MQTERLSSKNLLNKKDGVDQSRPSQGVGYFREEIQRIREEPIGHREGIENGKEARTNSSRGEELVSDADQKLK